MQELELRRCQAHRWHRSAGVQVCEHQLSRAQMEQDDFCLCDVLRARAVMFGMVQYFKAVRHLMYTVTSSLLRFVAFPRQSRELLFPESIAKGSSVRSPAEKIHRVKYIE